MAISVKPKFDGQLLEITVTGKLSAKDYEHFVPLVEQLLEKQDKVCMLVTMIDFEGWSACALWEDLKFDVKHFSDISRLALVGDKKWEKGMATFCRPFTTAKVKYFDMDNLGEAHEWLEEGLLGSNAMPELSSKC